MELGKGIDFLKMDARSAVVFQVSHDGKSPKEVRPLSVRTRIEEPITQSVYQFDVMAKEGVDSMFAILNNRWSTKQLVSNGTLSLNLKNLPNGKHQLEMLEYRNGQARFGDVIAFELGLPQQQLIAKEDPIGDDNGPEGKYLYPTDATFSHQMDLASANVSATGNNIEIKVKMVESLSTVWSPTNGFDHLELNILLAIPGQEGMSEIPRIDAQMPEGFTWNYQAAINGWNGMMLKAVNGEEQISSQKPRVKVDAEAQTISMTFPASIIGEPESLDGMSILITTWDGGGEGGLRPLESQPQGFTFGGGNTDDPKIMDQIWIPEIQINEE
jgi:carbohydrate-binding DOMON domain-containing protein